MIDTDVSDGEGSLSIEARHWWPKTVGVLGLIPVASRSWVRYQEKTAVGVSVGLIEGKQGYWVTCL